MMKADDDEMAQEKRDFDTRSSTSSDERSDTINRRAAEAKLDQIDLDSGGEESEPDESKRQREQKAVAEHKELRIETKIHALSAADEDSEGNYQLVKKSIYKASKKGFLSRLTGAASPAQGKYLVSEITGITTEEATSDGLQLTKSKLSDSDIGNDTGNDNAETAFEEEEGIQVSIDRSGQYARTDFTNSDRRRLNAEDAALGGPSEVIIHSGDSESGFATLNPVIRGSLKLSSGANCTPSHGGLPSPAMTKSSGIPVVKASPVLLEIPAAEEKNHPKERLQLIINALGATGLPKAEKFGTQSCLLEMKLFDINGGNTNSFLMRTELHKKGGSEAQWNQQFSTTLWSKESQFLHAEVKTSSKALVGEADIRLDKDDSGLEKSHL
ncbi:hypothetical protein PHYBOEH_008498 [Phytophthora boehmeriae]|uniref:C2 domain-containing protein n=1 Tax=Phytophthora boehmeriae TaxID=109152 RepID=A0A8T1X754_9STRA|nr:hypothetical protein PHYBOEH_008498 [Phytophthora boehmeriae]